MGMDIKLFVEHKLASGHWVRAEPLRPPKSWEREAPTVAAGLVRDEVKVLRNSSLFLFLSGHPMVWSRKKYRGDEPLKPHRGFPPDMSGEVMQQFEYERELTGADGFVEPYWLYLSELREYDWAKPLWSGFGPRPAEPPGLPLCEAFEQFYDEVLPELESYGDGDTVRLIYFFV
jgi:hypothetical protein